MTSPYLKYGLTSAEAAQILSDQQGYCALSSNECQGQLCLDHKGSTIRGFLCSYHNSAIGFFEVAQEHAEVYNLYIAGKLTNFVVSSKLAEKPNCAEDGCKEKAKARGYCDRHYGRAYRRKWASRLIQR